MQRTTWSQKKIYRQRKHAIFSLFISYPLLAADLLTVDPVPRQRPSLLSFKCNMTDADTRSSRCCKNDLRGSSSPTASGSGDVTVSFKLGAIQIHLEFQLAFGESFSQTCAHPVVWAVTDRAKWKSVQSNGVTFDNSREIIPGSPWPTSLPTTAPAIWDHRCVLSSTLSASCFPQPPIPPIPSPEKANP